MPARSARRWGSPHLVLWMLTLLALGLRLARLAFQPLWWDEGWSLYFATTDLGAMLELTAVDIHPPLYYVLLHAWIGLFGAGVISVRLLSVLIGTATVPLLYAAGRRLLGKRGGLLAAFLLAISPFHIYYSQEVRMYGLVTLLGVAALYCSLRMRDAPNWRWEPWLGYVLAAVAALYAHYYAALLLLALNLAVLVGWLRRRRPIREVLPWLAAQAAVAVLYLPWLWYAGGKLLSYVRFKIGVEADQSLGVFTYLGRHLAAFTWGHAEGALAGYWWLALLPLALLALACVLLFRRQPSAGEAGDGPPGMANESPSSPAYRGLEWIVLLGLLLGGFLLNLVLPFNPPRAERQMLLALPVYLLLVAAGLLALWRHRRSVAMLSGLSFLVMGLLSLGFFYAVPRYPEDDYRPVAERLRALGLPGDAVICIQPWQVGYVWAYLPDDQARPALVLTPREVIPRERQLWDEHPERMASDLDALLAAHGRLWLLDHRAMGRVLESQVEAYLVEHAYPVLSEWYGENTVLSLFAAREPVAQPISAGFGDWLVLESAALSPGPLEAGWGVATVNLTWRLLERPSDDYHVGLRLVGQTGHVWAQRDTPPLGGLESFSDWPRGQPRLDHHGLLVPAGTPPGDYRLTLRVYRAADVAVLPVSTAVGTAVEVTLGAVRVVRPQMPPPVEALGFARQREVQFGDRLRLLGFTQDIFDVRPGETVDVDLYWQALADPGQDFLPRLQLLQSGDEVVAQSTQKPVAGTYPTAWWQAGELVRDRQALPITATVPPGMYTLALSLVRAADGQPVEVQWGETWVGLGDIAVAARDHRYEPTVPAYIQAARFGPSMELVGYDLADTASVPGSLLAVTLHWHALHMPDENYHAFVHLLDAEGNALAQHDGPPGSGETMLPTLGWLPGEYIVDEHPLQLPPDLPGGEYRLGVGLYDPISWQRLGERVILDTPILIRSAP
jgi:4-amino-4-deoxy-L-arabinose transferase-like glycosyltransferase